MGEAGVGKTAIIEGLAESIVKEQVPDILKGKKVYSLDLGALMAGTKFRGEFEERLQKLLKFMKGQGGNAILFIDEIHQLVGAGRTDGAMDAANLLKPALARGELHCIGATTENEYQKYILGDSALARRFRSVRVKVPSIEDSIEILIGLKEKFEMHHGIKISDEAIEDLVRQHFDLRPKGLVAMLDLKRPIFLATAAYGHFGREEENFTWEKII